MTTSRQTEINGVSDCAHDLVEEVYSQGGRKLGGRCQRCGRLFGLGPCLGCQRDKRLWVVSEDGQERFCSEICRRALISQRAQGTASPYKRGRK